MLNKQICKKCWNHHVIKSGETAWNINDDRWWENGQVLCLANNRFVCVSDSCDEHCPYALEHLMSEQNNHAE